MQDERPGSTTPRTLTHSQLPWKHAYFRLTHSFLGTRTASALPTVIVVFFLVMPAIWIVSALTGGRGAAAALRAGSITVPVRLHRDLREER